MTLEGSPALVRCVGKRKVLAMTRQLVMKGGAYKIRANQISPDLIENSTT